MLWRDVPWHPEVAAVLEPWPEVYRILTAPWRRDDRMSELDVGPAFTEEFVVDSVMAAAGALATRQPILRLALSDSVADPVGPLWIGPGGDPESQMARPRTERVLEALLALLRAAAPHVRAVNVPVIMPRIAPWPGGLQLRWLRPFEHVERVIVRGPFDLAWLAEVSAHGRLRSIDVDARSLMPRDMVYSHMPALRSGRWLAEGSVAATLETLELSGMGLDELPATLPRLHTLCTAFLPPNTRSLAEAAPNLRRLYVQGRAIGEGGGGPAAAAAPTPVLPASLRVLSICNGARGVTQTLLRCLEGPLDALHLQIMHAEDAERAAAALCLAWEERPWTVASLRALSICPRGVYSPRLSSHDLGHWDSMPSGPSPAFAAARVQLLRVLSRPWRGLEQLEVVLPRSSNAGEFGLRGLRFPVLSALALYVNGRVRAPLLDEVASAAPMVREMNVYSPDSVIMEFDPTLPQPRLNTIPTHCLVDIGRRCRFLRRVRLPMLGSDLKVTAAMGACVELARKTDAAHRASWLKFVDGLGGVACPSTGIPWFRHSLGGRVADMLGWPEPFERTLQASSSDYMFEKLPGL